MHTRGRMNPYRRNIVRFCLILVAIGCSQAPEKSSESGPVTTPQFPVDDPVCSAIPSLPDPELVGLFFRKCHISSSSTTTARPSGSGFWAKAAANCSIQAITLGVETPSSLAVRFIDSPLR